MKGLLPLVFIAKLLAIMAIFVMLFLDVISISDGHPLATCYDYLIDEVSVDPTVPEKSDTMAVQVPQHPVATEWWAE